MFANDDTLVASKGSVNTRRIVHRTRGRGHGGIVRLMSPSDLGEMLKPFVFLDIIDIDSQSIGNMPVHPHSGIATVTVIAEGDLRFDDPRAGQGVIAHGGVEWMRAGGGVWHGKELSSGTSERIKGFQLWLALPPELENGAVESAYFEADAIPIAGPARVIIGDHNGERSPVVAPAGINYLLVTLRPGEQWTYVPPAGHTAAFVAIATGSIDAGEVLRTGDMALFDKQDSALTFAAGSDEDAIFVLGSAIEHPHDLVLGYYSVHTSHEALARGEARIAEIGALLPSVGAGPAPVFSG